MGGLLDGEGVEASQFVGGEAGYRFNPIPKRHFRRIVDPDSLGAVPLTKGTGNALAPCSLSFQKSPNSYGDRDGRHNQSRNGDEQHVRGITEIVNPVEKGGWFTPRASVFGARQARNVSVQRATSDGYPRLGYSSGP